MPPPLGMETGPGALENGGAMTVRGRRGGPDHGGSAPLSRDGRAQRWTPGQPAPRRRSAERGADSGRPAGAPAAPGALPRPRPPEEEGEGDPALGVAGGQWGPGSLHHQRVLINISGCASETQLGTLAQFPNTRSWGTRPSACATDPLRNEYFFGTANRPSFDGILYFSHLAGGRLRRAGRNVSHVFCETRSASTSCGRGHGVLPGGQRASSRRREAPCPNEFQRQVWLIFEYPRAWPARAIATASVLASSSPSSPSAWRRCPSSWDSAELLRRHSPGLPPSPRTPQGLQRQRAAAPLPAPRQHRSCPGPSLTPSSSWKPLRPSGSP